MKVLCVGHSSYDISMPISDFPKENTKNRLASKIECVGGPSLTASLLLGKWDTEVYLTSVIGNDIYGDAVIKALKENNVNTDYIIRKEEIETTRTFILVNEKNASRTLFNVKSPIEVSENIEYKIEPDIILVDGEHYNLAVSAIKKFPNAIRVIDAGKYNQEIVKIARICDYVVCSKEFAELASKEKIDFSDADSLKRVFNNLEKEFPGNILITIEEKGCIYKLEDKIKMMSGIKVRAKDTTSAGDIFHGAFVYGLSKNLPLEKCLKIANIAAGLSVKVMGSSVSIPDVVEVYKIYEKNR